MQSPYSAQVNLISKHNNGEAPQELKGKNITTLYMYWYNKVLPKSKYHIVCPKHLKFFP